MRFLLAILLFCFTSQAASIITATVTVTNAPTTNGMTIVVNGSTRTWTNAVSTPASQILTNDSIGGVLTNLYSHVLVTPFSGPVNALQSGTNAVLLRGAIDQAMAVTFGGTWASVTYSTQTVSSLTAIRVPGSSLPVAVRTNEFSLLTTALSDYSTNVITGGSTFASALVALTNAQTISGAKQITNAAGLFGNGQITNAELKSQRMRFDNTNANGIYFYSGAGGRISAIAPDVNGLPSVYGVITLEQPTNGLSYTPAANNLLTKGGADITYGGLATNNTFTSTNTFTQITNTFFVGGTITNSTLTNNSIGNATLYGTFTNGAFLTPSITNAVLTNSTINGSTLNTNTLVNPFVTGNLGIGLSPLHHPGALDKGITFTNGTAPGVNATNGAVVWTDSGELKYRASGTSEGAGQDNRFHNRAAQVTGSGTDYTIPDTAFNLVDFGGTEPEFNTLPSAGTFLLVATVTITAGAECCDTFNAKFRDATAGSFIADSVRSVSNITEGKTAQIVIHYVSTFTAASRVQIYVQNSTAARGTIVSTLTSISYVRLY